MSSYCSENNFFQTFLYLLAYFIGILLLLHVINLCGPFDKLVSKLGKDTYQYWMTYELLYRPNVPKEIQRFRCLKVRLTRLDKPDGRNNGYLQKLGNGSCYSMGSRGILTERGCSLSPISCATCGLWSSDCFCCSCLRLPPGLFEDFIYYLFNNHGFLSTICAERDNPYSRTERNFAFFGLGCLTFFGNVIAQIIGFSDTEGAAWDIAFIGVLNFLLTNVFEVLFSCTFFFHATDAHHNEAVLHYYLRKFFSWVGSVLGILLALGIGLFLLLISSAVCGGRGENLLSFTLSSQLVGIGLDFVFILLQYIPLVIHIKDLPCIGSRTLCGRWYRERYLYHFYQKPEDFFVNPINQMKQVREKRGPITSAPVYGHEAVPEAHLHGSTLHHTESSKVDGPRKNFCYIQINFCKCCCCSCLCFPYLSCAISRDEGNTTLVAKNEKDDKVRTSADGFNVFEIYGV